MPTYNEILKQIDKNQQTITEHGKFDEALLKKINYKLRLDWNYYSNRIEGGTLTRAETRSVMVGNIDVQGKPIRDVMEMNGHDKVIVDVLKMGKGELSLSEKRIKDIHKAIMYEDDPTKLALVGNWKKDTNEIINYKGEKFTFASPDDVPQSVHQKLDGVNSNLEALSKGINKIHPIVLAAQFHIDFVSIHPFYDGNGRTTRILTNIILIACGYPPIVIKDKHKKQYYQLLADIQVYGGHPSLFFAFIGERVLDTQQLILDAIGGKDIDEEDDIDKLIHQAKLELSQKNAVINRPLNRTSAKLLLELCIRNCFEYIYNKSSEFEDEFVRVNKQIDFQINNSGKSVGNQDSLDKVFDNISQILLSETNEIRRLHIGFYITFYGFKKSADEKYVQLSMQFNLNDLMGKIELEVATENPIKHTFYYNDENGGLTFDEVKKHLDELLRAFIQHIIGLSK
ncbi:MAG: Fic family protein [Bacteroidia bacterium]|jgi:Fic family protein|nr:Fic family protein [Bacteroidia bacterium]